MALNGSVVGDPRVHHVVWCVRRESLHGLEQYWTETLGVPLASVQHRP